MQAVPSLLEDPSCGAPLVGGPWYQLCFPDMETKTPSDVGTVYQTHKEHQVPPWAKGHGSAGHPTGYTLWGVAACPPELA